MSKKEKLSLLDLKGKILFSDKIVLLKRLSILLKNKRIDELISQIPSDYKKEPEIFLKPMSKEI